jgi:hypothetical protein
MKAQIADEQRIEYAEAVSDKRKLSKCDWAAILLAAFLVVGPLFPPFFVKIATAVNNIASYGIYNYVNKKIEKSS